jgi:pimeloyl-ACP methyl ester carboxylesterase
MPKDLHSEEVTYTVDDIPVYATLTRPEGKGPFPAVVFVAGSGPTDRDWCTPLLPGTNGSAHLLAEALTREGFVTLRYDKRFSGPHAMENLPKMMGKISMQAHTDELAGAVGLLAADKDVDPGRVFVLSNSEGAIHALHYQLQATGLKFHGMVLTGAPGRSIADVARSQIQAQVAGLPDGDVMMQHFDAAVADFVAGRPLNPDPALPEGARLLLAGLATPANQPFSRELWSANPTGLLAKVTAPVLVVIGKKDLQVDWQLDGKPLEEAVRGHGNVTFAYPEDSNHVLKYEPVPRESLVPAGVGANYNAEDRILDPETWNIIRNWLKEHE